MTLLILTMIMTLSLSQQNYQWRAAVRSDADRILECNQEQRATPPNPAGLSFGTTAPNREEFNAQKQKQNSRQSRAEGGHPPWRGFGGPQGPHGCGCHGAIKYEPLPRKV